MQKSNDDHLKVFISNRESTCNECGEALGSQAWIVLKGEKGAVCLTCADMDHLVFLPAGDTALTRRSSKYSALHGLSKKLPETKHPRNRLGAYFSG